MTNREVMKQQAEPVACKKLCELCVKRGYDFCEMRLRLHPSSLLHPPHPSAKSYPPAKS